MTRKALRGTASLITLALLTIPAHAEPAAPADGPIERISVVGSREKQQDIPGSAHYIGKIELERFEYDDIHQILRQVPGVVIQEEEGFGLRPNIGLRGSGVERSQKITLMEDGVLIAPAPYSAPAAYYFPTAGRMEAIEVRKGSSAIKFGPRTVGGAINLVSTSIPDEFGGRVDARLGSDSLYQIHAYGGGSTEHLGALVETYQASSDGFKKLDGGGDTGYEIEDYLAKFRLNTAEDADLYQSLELKFGYTEQRSDETYLGLTDDDFAVTPYRRYAASQQDLMDTEHWQVQATHYAQFSERFDLTTVAYYNDFKRAWYKLNDVNAGNGTLSLENALNDATALAILRGEADSADGALRVRNNNRAYYAWGVQSVAGFTFETGTINHDLEISVRYHEDEEDFFQNDDRYRMVGGRMVLTSAGAPGSQSNRVSDAQAWAFYIQDEIEIGRWLIVPGVRYETIDFTRISYGTSDPDRTAPTEIVESSADAVTPGIGVTYSVTDEISIIAGVHRGFSPPGPGSVDAREERSTNWEAGVRYNSDILAVEAIAFYNDYANILGACTASVGCAVGEIGDQFNGGKARVKGLEFLASADLGAQGDVGLSIPLSLSYTYTDAEFRSSFDSGFWGDVSRGDALPYQPRHHINATIGVAQGPWALDLTANHLSAMRTEAGSGAIPLAEKVGGHTVVDLAGRYQLTGQLRLFASVQNLFDNEYAVARRPAGLRPGKPRTFIAGVSMDF